MNLGGIPFSPVQSLRVCTFQEAELLESRSSDLHTCICVRAGWASSGTRRSCGLVILRDLGDAGITDHGIGLCLLLATDGESQTCGVCDLLPQVGSLSLGRSLPTSVRACVRVCARGVCFLLI